jgi:UDPglucose 6-dehydrogenase
MRVVMIGSGYVGLVSGACFSEFGHRVTCIDMDEAKIAALRNGKIPLYEPGLDVMVESNRTAGRLDFDSDLKSSVAEADAVFIAVGTPARRGDGHADLSYVRAAAEEIAAALSGYTVVVTKSTVPVGTGDEVERIIRQARPDADFDVASNPEFLREGSAIEDFMRPDRVVVGCARERAKDVMGEIYRSLSLNKTPIMFTERRTAELIKYAANAFLAVKITFINEIADLCEKTGADVQDVSLGMGLDGRIGSKFLHAGPGYGGSCFPKDTMALMHTAEDFGSEMQIVQATIGVNDSRKRAMAERVVAACGGSVDGKTIAVLGLTFKPNTDDMRESPSLEIIPALVERGAAIRAFDPEGMDEAAALLPDINYCADAYDAMVGADALVIITEWNEFRALDLKRVRESMKAPVMVDLRNIYDPKSMAAAGFSYHSIGRAVATGGNGGDG